MSEEKERSVSFYKNNIISKVVVEGDNFLWDALYKMGQNAPKFVTGPVYCL